ncbi:MAG: amino acid permease [Pirellulales bacterium]|nr:amino acid permease [Pirellulales bacterium]
MLRWRQLFKRKSLEGLIAELAGENRLRRALGPVSLTALGVGCIIGAGIFVMTGRAAAEDAGPAVMVSYAVAALGCVFAALCYAEFAALAPVAGSAYTYSYATLGELFAWIIGWDLILEYAMACACVAAGWGNYLNEFLDVAFDYRIPDKYCSAPTVANDALFNMPAVGIMIVITIILIVGIRESAITNAVLTVVKLAVVLFVIGIGFTLINEKQNNWTDVPYAQRKTAADYIDAEAVVTNVMREDDAESGEKELTDDQRVQIKNDAAYLRAYLTLKKIEQVTAEGTTKGDLTTEQAAAQVADAQRQLESTPATAPPRERLEKYLDAVGEKELQKWGIVRYVVKPETLQPIDNAVRSNFAPYGLSGIMLGAAIVFFAFIGFDSISTHAEEAINPQRDVPIAILASLGICTVLYILVAAVITGMEPYPEIDAKAAIAAAFRKQAEAKDSGLLRLSSLFISTGALAGLTSVLLVTFLSQARIFLAMARDKLLPPSIFGTVHPRFKTPHISTALTGFCICIVAALTPIEALGEMVNIGTLFAFTVVCITVLILRIQKPEMPRPFRCPLLYVVAPAGVIVNVAMMLFLPLVTWVRLFVWMAIGMAFYFAYGYRHSILGKELMTELAKEGVGPTDAPLR